MSFYNQQPFYMVNNEEARVQYVAQPNAQVTSIGPTCTCGISSFLPLHAQGGPYRQIHMSNNEVRYVAQPNAQVTFGGEIAPIRLTCICGRNSVFPLHAQSGPYRQIHMPNNEVRYVVQPNAQVTFGGEIAPIRPTCTCRMNSVLPFHAQGEPYRQVGVHIGENDAPLAPHERIPPEIWFHIFSFCVTEAEDQQHFRPKLSEAPWLLGRVCSSWREMSRADSFLWEGMCPKIEISSRATALDLARAHDVLPSFVPMCISLRFNIDFDTKFIPYVKFGRLEELALKLYPTDLNRFLWNMSRHRDAFSNIWWLKISLKLPRWEDSQIDNMAFGWDILAPLQNAKSLGYLTVASRLPFPLTSLHAPWTQLNYLKLTISTDFRAIANVLRMCTSLKDLQLDFRPLQEMPMPNGVTHISADDSASLYDALSSLVNMKDFGFYGPVPTTVFRHTPGLKYLERLDTSEGDVDAGSMCRLIDGSRESLKTLIMIAPEFTPDDVLHLHDIHMPSLVKLELHTIPDNQLLRVLKTYALKTLELPNPMVTVDLAAVRSMIGDSASSVSTFTLHTSDEDETELFEILSALSAVKNIDIRGIVLSERIINGIATRTILPRLRSLYCSMPNDVVTLYMAETRASMAENTVAPLQEVKGNVDSLHLTEKEREKRVALTQDRYGMDCNIYLLPNSVIWRPEPDAM